MYWKQIFVYIVQIRRKIYRKWSNLRVNLPLLNAWPGIAWIYFTTVRQNSWKANQYLVSASILFAKRFLYDFCTLMTCLECTIVICSWSSAYWKVFTFWIVNMKMLSKYFGTFKFTKTKDFQVLIHLYVYCIVSTYREMNLNFKAD